MRCLATLRKRKQRERMTEEKQRSERAHDVDRHCAVEEYSESERNRKSMEASRLGDKAVTTPLIFALCTARSKSERSVTSRFILGITQ